jgi:zinc protease
LYKRLVYDDQIATQTNAHLDEREIGGQFVLIATAKQGVDLRKVVKALDEEMAQFLEKGPTERELQRIKAQSYASFVRGVERIGGFGGKSDILATSVTYDGRADAYKERLARLEKLTSLDLRDTAREWLADGVYTLEVEPFGNTKAASVALDRSALPPLGPPHELKLPTLQEASLSNGLRVLLAERHEIPVVNFWLEINSGFASDETVLPGTAKLASSLLTGGTQRRTALEISEELQMLGAQLSSGCNLDMATVYLTSLKATLDEGLDIFADVILHPDFPESDFERQRHLQLSAIANEKVTPIQMALRALPPILYGKGHAYGSPLTGSGTEESVQAIKREDMQRYHDTWFKPNNATLVVVGDTTMAEIKPKLEALFAGWKPSDVPVKHMATVPRPAKPAIYLVDKPGALHSVVLSGTIAPPPKMEDEVALETMNNVFGGSFSSRLNMNLREEKHWSYGAGSVLYGATAQRPFLAYSSVQGDKTADSIAEILKELKGMLGAEPVTEEELEATKQQQILELPGQHETMNSVGGLFVDLMQQGLPLDFYSTYVSKVTSLTTEDITAAARKVLDPAHTIWMVVGDRKELEPALKALNIGEIIAVEA